MHCGLGGLLSLPCITSELECLSVAIDVLALFRSNENKEIPRGQRREQYYSRKCLRQSHARFLG